MGASLGSFCPDCQNDLSKGLSAILATYPNDRVALLSHTQDATIRGFFGTYTIMPTAPFVTLTPMDATTFQNDLTALASTVIAPKANGGYFYTAGTGHPTLDDPAAIGTPAPGLPAWIEEMVSDSPAWASVAPP
jgi:hypothetical protein